MNFNTKLVSHRLKRHAQADRKLHRQRDTQTEIQTERDKQTQTGRHMDKRTDFDGLEIKKSNKIRYESRTF